MVAHHDDDVALAGRIQHTPDQRIHAQVEIGHDLFPCAAGTMRPILGRSARELGIVMRMPGIVMPPQHVPAQVDARGVEEQEAAARIGLPARQGVIHQAQTFVVHDIRLRKELTVAESAVLHGAHVFRHALRVVEPDRIGHQRTRLYRRRHGRDRRARINVDR